VAWGRLVDASARRTMTSRPHKVRRWWPILAKYYCSNCRKLGRKIRQEIRSFLFYKKNRPFSRKKNWSYLYGFGPQNARTR